MNSRAATESARTRAQTLEQGRESFRKHAWREAFSQFLAAEREAPLEPEDLVQLAQAAQLTGRMTESAEFLSRAHQAFLNREAPKPAARCAFWLGFTALISGEAAKAGGWLSRASRLLEDQPDCVERGYLLLPEGYRALHAGDPAAAHGHLTRAAEYAKRFGDKDLAALALQGQGRALIRQGEITRGVALLDEAMIAVTAGEVSPLNAGGVYCSVLEACGEIFDLRRAQEWTSELEKWCASQPDLVPFRGSCLLHRAELLQLHGAWMEALEWAQRAAEWFSNGVPRPDAGAAYYRVGEIHRLRGELPEADEAYHRASQWSRFPGPGPALLRLAQGRVEAANAAIRRILEEVQEAGQRAGVLEASVEIALAAKDAAAARCAAQELSDLADRLGASFLRALACRASGAVFLADGNAREGLTNLRESWRLWCELHAPYEAARTQVLIGLALRTMGDEEDADQEFTSARDTFRQLGASVDLPRVEDLLSKRPGKASGPLTEREVEVLRLVASGITNRGIANKLRLSEKTVARHVSNIFTKLDLSSRAAATAYAYEHHLV